MNKDQSVEHANLDISGFIDRLNKLHNDPQLDEQEKLKEKDKHLIDNIVQLDKDLSNAKKWLQPGMYELFDSILRALIMSEFIFHELKKLPGDPPFPKPPQPHD